MQAFIQNTIISTNDGKFNAFAPKRSGIKV